MHWQRSCFPHQQRHAGRGIEPQHYLNIGSVLAHVLPKWLGTEATAWSTAWAVFANALSQIPKQDLPNRENTNRNISKSEFIRHRTAESLWVTAFDLVYDVTQFAPSHPGGAVIFERENVTSLFNGFHSAGARQLLASFCIGKLGPADTRVEEFFQHAQEVIPGLFLGSENAGEAALEALGINYVLVPAKTGRPVSYPNCTLMHLNLFDVPGAPVLGEFDRACRFIAYGLEHGRVLVHCAQGVSRSPAFVLAYLTLRLSLPDALALLKKKRPQVDVNKYWTQLEVWANSKGRPTEQDLAKYPPLRIGRELDIIPEFLNAPVNAALQ